jgi:uncharacterized membrane protein YjjP (DUF1212 family)
VEQIDYNSLILVGSNLGRQLLQNGAEIYRVEESMSRFFKAYHVSQCDLFVLTSCINVTLQDSAGQAVTRILRINDYTTDMDKVEKLNDLCRKTCETTPPLETVQEELKKIEETQAFPYKIQMLGFIGLASASTLFFGGNFVDAVISGIAGICMQWVLFVFEKYRANSFFANLVASAVSALVAVLALQILPQLHLDKIIMGAIMNLVPGIAITSFMRDLLSRDYLSGTLRLVESLLVATAIALGTGAVLAFFRFL